MSKMVKIYFRSARGVETSKNTPDLRITNLSFKLCLSEIEATENTNYKL